jgi:hypothetical protein
MYPTVATLQEAVLQELNLVGGSAVQTYTEPQILETVNDCFRFLFDKRFWDHLTNTSEHTLDGVAGVITDEVVKIAKVQDIKWIRKYPFEEHDELYYDIEGTWKDGDRDSFSIFTWDDAQAENKMFTVFPKTTTGTIRVRARRMPVKFTTTADIVPFDEVCLKHFVVSTMLAADGMNPGNEARHAALFDQRYQDLITQDNVRILRYGRNRPDSFTVAS